MKNNWWIGYALRALIYVALLGMYYKQVQNVQIIMGVAVCLILLWLFLTKVEKRRVLVHVIEFLLALALFACVMIFRHIYPCLIILITFNFSLFLQGTTSSSREENQN